MLEKLLKYHIREKPKVMVVSYDKIFPFGFESL